MAKAVKKLVRPQKGKMIGGVAMGIANYFNIDPSLVRIILVLLLIPGGLPGLLPYLIAWVIIPSE